jgi:hypothetical protein
VLRGGVQMVAPMKSCVRALAVISLLAILILSVVPGAFRPHAMILPPGFEHVAAYDRVLPLLGLLS